MIFSPAEYNEFFELQLLRTGEELNNGKTQKLIDLVRREASKLVFLME